MRLQNKKAKVDFLKETGSIEKQISELEQIKEKVDLMTCKGIDRDLQMLRYGKIGEDNIIFELKHSGIPMYVLHDIYIEHEGLSAQIDFVVITEKIDFIIECKNLYGNIKINSRGDFTRSINFNGVVINEGIYSPITQNQRHLEILKNKEASTIKNVLKQSLFKRYFPDYNKSVVVLANPKTILNCRYAKENIRNQIIRCDQLTEYIKNEINKSKEASSSNKNMKERAEKILEYNTANPADYTKKYKELIELSSIQPMNKEESDSCGIVYDADIVSDLKLYRLEQSHKEHVEAYYIFTNKMLDVMIEQKPATMRELRQIPGFGDTKISKYGKSILKIINR